MVGIAHDLILLLFTKIMNGGDVSRKSNTPHL